MIGVYVSSIVCVFMCGRAVLVGTATTVEEARRVRDAGLQVNGVIYLFCIRGG